MTAFAFILGSIPVDVIETAQVHVLIRLLLSNSGQDLADGSCATFTGLRFVTSQQRTSLKVLCHVCSDEFGIFDIVLVPVRS